MSRMVRFSSAALGMVLLAGLAFYQGRVEIPPGEEGILSGTALVEPAETAGSDCDQPAESEGGDIKTCAEKEPSHESN